MAQLILNLKKLAEEAVNAEVKRRDLVEAVRCKDCKHNPHNTTDDVCPFVDEKGYVKHFPEEDGFCKWGERREE